MNISETLKTSAGVLKECGIAEPFRETGSLLAFALGRDRTFLVAHSEYELTVAEETHFQHLLNRRKNREPFQHITGRQEFYGLDFEVSKDVLIPRPETELIVENAIEYLRKISNPRFCEVGIGSGCIAISILNNVKSAEAVGLDISTEALKIAERNAANHDVGNRLNLLVSDLFDELPSEQFDLVASNPPYIPQSDFDQLQPEVRLFDPEIALTDGDDGLSIIEKIVLQSFAYLKPNGLLLIEIGIGQSETVKKMFSEELWQTVEIIDDLKQIPRTVKALKK